MIDLLFNVLAGAGIFCTLLGLFVLVVTLALPKKKPMDTSNRINHLTLVWFALSQPHTFVELYHTEDNIIYETAFPWLTEDQGGNVDGAI